MSEIQTAEVRDYLLRIQGREVDLTQLRKEFGIAQEDKSWDGIRNIMYQLAEGRGRLVRPSGRRDGVYIVIKQVKPLKVFGEPRDKKPPFPIKFPKDYDTEMEFSFAQDIVIRSGDCILLPGESNWGKTTLAMQICGENIDLNPILMGNEFSRNNKLAERFLDRLTRMDWIQWTNGDGQDKFTLLPVHSEYPEYIVPDRLNILDWVRLDPNRLYEIEGVMDAIKENIGDGVAVVVIQKGEGTEAGRGGQFTHDFADLELLVDRHSRFESRLTIGKVKESISPVTGRTWAFEIEKGVKLHNVREIVQCPSCYGKKWKKIGISNIPCDDCKRTGFIDK